MGAALNGASFCPLSLAVIITQTVLVRRPEYAEKSKCSFESLVTSLLAFSYSREIEGSCLVGNEELPEMTVADEMI